MYETVVGCSHSPTIGVNYGHANMNIAYVMTAPASASAGQKS